MKVHLSAICGTAMASLAGLLRDRGHVVSGSDQDVYPPMSTQLAALGIEIRSPYHADNVPADADVVVIGNALSRGNPEVEVVLDRKQRAVSMPALLADELLRDRTSIVVAGTHGKTTTSSLVAFLLDRAGRDPSFLIGGVPQDFGRSYRLSAGPHFVVEGDEYDCAFFDKRPKFVHYLPDVAVVGNVEFDHADIYPDLAAVETAFGRLLSVLPRRGRLIAGIESPAVARLVPSSPAPVDTFGLAEGARFRAVDLRTGPGGTAFRLLVDGTDHGAFTMPLAGEHNVRNALAALAAVGAVGVAPEEVREALGAFRGVKRRLELRGVVRGVSVYDDFAHHPDRRARDPAGAARPGAGGRPPRRRLRAAVLHVAHARLPGRLRRGARAGGRGRDRGRAPAGQGAGRGAPVGGRDGRRDRRRRRPGLVPDVPAIVAHVAAAARSGDVVAILSNGGFGGIHDRLLDALHP